MQTRRRRAACDPSVPDFLLRIMIHVWSLTLQQESVNVWQVFSPCKAITGRQRIIIRVLGTAASVIRFTWRGFAWPRRLRFRENSRSSRRLLTNDNLKAVKHLSVSLFISPSICGPLFGSQRSKHPQSCREQTDLTNRAAGRIQMRLGTERKRVPQGIERGSRVLPVAMETLGGDRRLRNEPNTSQSSCLHIPPAPCFSENRAPLPSSCWHGLSRRSRGLWFEASLESAVHFTNGFLLPPILCPEEQWGVVLSFNNFSTC